jgi:SanA protein
LKIIFRIIVVLLAGAILVTGLSRLFTELYSNSRLYLPANVPPSRVAIVFGAGLTWDGSPSPVLKDRVATAADLYFSGKIQKILMSGDNRFLNYNEPGAMLDYALELGVPRQDIILDYAGRRTYDTCYRARAIFGVTEALLVTQRFHLPRALFTCNFLGIKGYGVIADRRPYNSKSLTYWNLREVGATVVALWNVWVTRPLPVLGTPEPIFPPRSGVEKNKSINSQSGTNIAQR